MAKKGEPFAIGEIHRLRGGIPTEFLPLKGDGYRIDVREADGGLTSYCFSLPVYGDDGGLLRKEWKTNGAGRRFKGASAHAETDGDGLVLSNAAGSVRATFFGDVSLTPACNGVAVFAAGSAAGFLLEENVGCWSYQRSRQLVLMRGLSDPFAVVNGWIAYSGNGCVPVEISAEQLRPGAYFVSAAAENANGLRFGLCLHSDKLIYDTVVSQAEPEGGSPYGAVAFFGTRFGEEWLYSRPDAGRLSDLEGLEIYSATLYAHRFCGSGRDLTAYFANQPWCDLKLSWAKRALPGGLLSRGEDAGEYVRLNITSALRGVLGGQTPGIVIVGDGCTAIATGDHDEFPQILEIKIRK